MNLINLKIALRSLGRHKFYSVLSISGIALTFIFISVIVMYLRQTTGNYPPTIYNDRTIMLDNIPFANGKATDIDSSRVDYYKQLKEPEYIAFLNWQSPFIFNGYKVIWTPTGFVNSDFFNIFHFRYIAGRPFNKEEEENKITVLVMSQEYAKSFFGRTDVLGESIKVQGTIFSIIGIYEKPNWQRTFSENNLYIPRAFNKFIPQGHTSQDVYLKAKDTRSIKTVSDEVNRLHQQFFKQGTIESPPADREWKAMKDNVSDSFYISLSISMLFLLLIPAFNILSLNSGKIMDQIQEISIKRAYGATKLNVLGNLMLENIALTIAGAALGLLLTYPVLQMINSFINKFDEATMTLSMQTDIYTIGIIFILTLAFSLLSSFIPARKVINSNISEELKGGHNE
jgi:putative ABC transport system permease protein